MPRHLNESYRPLIDQWLDPLGKMFKDGYEEFESSRSKWSKDHSGSEVPVDWNLGDFHYDILQGNVTFEKIWDIIKN